MSEILTPDICVIGAGSGGLSLAAAAASFGRSVILVERDKMGGDCLNYGCVPSKALISIAKQANAVQKASQYGIQTSSPIIDAQKVHNYVQNVIAAIAPNDSEERFQALGVRVIKGSAEFINHKTLKVNEFNIHGKHFVIATGSSPFIPSIPGIEDIPYLTNKTIYNLTQIPQKLIIIGGGAIGVEMAQTYHRLGSDVTVLETFKALNKNDPELAEIILDSLRYDGIIIRENVTIKNAKKTSNGISITFQTELGEETITGTHVLIAAGRTPNISDLKLNKAGIKFNHAISVNKSLRTSNRRVYAIGDVIGHLQFTHAANYHAGLVIRSILFRLPVREKLNIIPWVIFTEPELAMVGLSEKMARQKYEPIRILRWHYADNDRAQAEGKASGLIKIITTKRGKVLGAGIVGPHAGETINSWALAVAKGMHIRDFASYIAPYPTFSEISKRVAVSFYVPYARNKWIQRAIAFLRPFG